MARKKFRLSLTNVEKLVTTKIQPQYPQVEFEIYQAKSSNSIYVRCKYQGEKATVRLSDHDTPKYVQSVIVGKSTKISYIQFLIDGAVERVKRKCVYRLFEKLEKEKKDGTQYRSNEKNQNQGIKVEDNETSGNDTPTGI